MEINRGTHKCAENKRLWSTQSKWDVFINPSLQGWGIYEGGRNIVRARGDSKETHLQTQQGWYPHEPTETLTACTSPAQGQNRQNPSTKRKWTQSPTPNQEAIWNCCLIAKGKSVFSNGMSLGLSTSRSRSRPRATWCFLWTFCLALVFFVLMVFFS